jgi:serine/threonine protein kinase
MDLSERLDALRHELESDTALISTDALLDTLDALFVEVKKPSLKVLRPVACFSKRYTESHQKIKSLRVSKNDFMIVQLIGQGAFGEVSVAKFKPTGDVYAMKVQSKSDLVERGDQSFFWEEREIMARTSSPWLIKLMFAFHDHCNLYMVMEYAPGGDLLGLMIKFDFDEKISKFYAAQTAMAINALHEMGFAHRDIKPENILVDARGHVKLADFGTAARLDRRGLIAKPPAGTADYVSPETLSFQTNGMFSVN